MVLIDRPYLVPTVLAPRDEVCCGGTLRRY